MSDNPQPRYAYSAESLSVFKVEILDDEGDPVAIAYPDLGVDYLSYCRVVCKSTLFDTFEAAKQHLRDEEYREIQTCIERLRIIDAIQEEQ